MTFNLLTMIMWACVASTGATIVYIAYLNLDEITRWFLERESLIVDQDDIAFTVQEKQSSGHYRIIQGIFNTKNHQIVEARTIKYDLIDREIANAHSDAELVIYQ
ncbi:hypothetical protein [Microseira wollei]|uniref:Uncharacterized protein n=1 Tax=Microseira wollei NIES-4236 TaxID=2530354 RepID=A0AAV3XC14_9CYAN|nr:hypothetical protein [Microseira wollei]GET39844.1 hypothetical protein MiSe_46160 [Microseira wollei NIES-4236]